MKFIIGLGNPEEKYEGTRHNVGRDLLKTFIKKNKFDDFEYDQKINAQITEGKFGKEKVTFILPNTYMNNSGLALKKFITSTKKAGDMMVVCDDLDMGVGTMRIVFNKDSAGHRGVDSVIRAVKTKAFSKLKIGISPASPSGKVKKPSGTDKVVKHVLGKFSPKEQALLKKMEKRILGALEEFVVGDYLSAMNKFN